MEIKDWKIFVFDLKYSKNSLQLLYIFVDTDIFILWLIKSLK